MPDDQAEALERITAAVAGRPKNDKGLVKVRAGDVVKVCAMASPPDAMSKHLSASQTDHGHPDGLEVYIQAGDLAHVLELIPAASLAVTKDQPEKKSGWSEKPLT